MPSGAKSQQFNGRHTFDHYKSIIAYGTHVDGGGGGRCIHPKIVSVRLKKHGLTRSDRIVLSVTLLTFDFTHILVVQYRASSDRTLPELEGHLLVLPP